MSKTEYQKVIYLTGLDEFRKDTMSIPEDIAKLTIDIEQSSLGQTVDFWLYKSTEANAGNIWDVQRGITENKSLTYFNVSKGEYAFVLNQKSYGNSTTKVQATGYLASELGIETNTNTIGTGINTGVNTGVNNTNTAITTATNTINVSVANDFSKISESIENSSFDVASSIGTLTNQLKDINGSTINDISKTLDNLEILAQGTFDTIVDTIKHPLEALTGSISYYLTALGNTIKDVFTVLAQSIDSIFFSLAPYFLDLLGTALEKLILYSIDTFDKWLFEESMETKK